MSETSAAPGAAVPAAVGGIMPDVLTRYCFVSRVDPAHLDAYRARHAAVWPEMLAALRDAGWQDYSLFLGEDGTLVGTFRADDKDLAQTRMSATDVNARWQAEMSRLFAGDGSPDEEFVYLSEVFHLADQLRAAGLPTGPRPAGGAPRDV